MMLIKSLQKISLLDYLGKTACIIFTGGCNFRCPFCQNPELVKNDNKLPTISEKEVLEFLKSRVGKLDGVVITGGEPTIHQDLPEFLKKIKELEFAVKLDTNGTNPEMVEKLIEQKLLDYVALDYKGPFDKYDKIVQSSKFKVQSQNFKFKIKKTIKILIKNKIIFELRTTVVPSLHQRKDLIEMAKEISKQCQTSDTRHAANWYLQNFRPNKCLDKKFEEIKPYPRSFFEEILPELQQIYPITIFRG